jgi:hypothetical protein
MAEIEGPGPGAVRPLTTGLRRLLFVASGLVALAGFQLFVLTDHTDRYFSWTIQPGLTAAFLGAGYTASFFFEFLSARRRAWADARHSVPAVLVFTVLTEVATLLHLDKFHFGERFAWAGAAAWVWIGIYTLVPLTMIGLIPGQLRTRGADPPRRAPLPSWSAWVLGVQAAVLLSLGVALFVAPSRSTWWPWTLTPLTSQAVGAWLIGIGVGLVHAIIEADLERIRPGLIAITVLGALQLVALARYPGDVEWGHPGTWVYVAFVASVLVVGAMGLVGATAAERRAAMRSVER